ncbi:hypothetical protein Tco_0905154 [Tanacetum coccineum]
MFYRFYQEVDVHLYRSMIGSLMYFTSSRPDIMFAVCACARYQVNPKVSHLYAVKRIFRYLKGQLMLGLWYPKDSPFDLVAYTDSDYAGASLDRKSTTEYCQFLGIRLISWIQTDKNVADSLTKAFDEQVEGLDMPTDPHHTPTIIPPSTLQPQGKQRPRKLKTKDIEIPQSSVLVENVADKAVYEERITDPIQGVNTPQSGEDSLQLKELMEFCTKLQQRVLDLENTKTAQAHVDETSWSSARDDSSDDEATHGCHMDSTHFDTNLDMFGVHDLDGDEVFVETEEHVVNAAKTTTQALAELKNIKPKAVTIAATITTTAVTRPKAKGLVIQEQEQASTPITSSKDNGKGIMVEEPLKMKKKDQVETGYELAQRLQAEEQEELTIEENSKLFQQLLEKRRMHFAAKRAEE